MKRRAFLASAMGSLLAGLTLRPGWAKGESEAAVAVGRLAIPGLPDPRPGALAPRLCGGYRCPTHS